MAAAEHPRVPWLVVAGGLTAILVVLVRTAWLSDDAYITLRSVDNLVSGFGPRWNVAERVQAFTHPAWLLLITPFYALTREAFFTVLSLQIVLTLATAVVLLRWLVRSPSDAVLFVALFIGSKACVEFSTSGLENPLAHLLLALFLVHWLHHRGDRPILLGLLTSGLLLCRLDLGVLVAPMLVASLWPIRRDRIARFALGLVPFVAWELFSLIYYGMLVPNTALAKLPPGVPLTHLISQGWKYFPATFHFDPLTPIAIAAGLLVLLVWGERAGRVVAAGVVLHLLYVVCVGGDFMTGRFLTPAFVTAIAAAFAVARWQAPLIRRAVTLGVLGLALLNPVGPLRTGSDFGVVQATADEFERHGVTDERRVYYPSLGLLRVLSGTASPDRHDYAQYGLRLRSQRVDVLTASSIGIAGYYAGPAVHIIDRNALADPLLSRLPPEPGWRIGHFVRDGPPLYLESLRRNENLIEDPGVRMLYEDVRVVTRAPLFSAGRFPAIWRLTVR